ncbi:hypothetical protein NEOLI_003046 [Neolecta irregularis DAH-3]|uniref:Uncharacterized protein n=1 Tax=Neolecta irregularis (strain DAH-3) TaxID=1198029 RepID=A0A1U7LU20_NEOID|nr:hypothetical protein NEOLI_003046 [Neolecta irregularis DAH-3]|eukprot:OLL26144.1 hypothetical protein NEOLI_003046 [Neolecta irregularis DAH-3]
MILDSSCQESIKEGVLTLERTESKMKFSILALLALSAVTSAVESTTCNAMCLMVRGSGIDAFESQYLYVDRIDKKLYINLSRYPSVNDSTFVLKSGRLKHKATLYPARVTKTEISFTLTPLLSNAFNLFSFNQHGMVQYAGSDVFYACKDESWGLTRWKVTRYAHTPQCAYSNYKSGINPLNRQL